MSQVLGIINFYWNGQHINIKPGGTVKLGGIVNKPVIYGKQVAPAQHMSMSQVKLKAVVTAGMSVTGTFGTNVGEMQVECDTGQIFGWPEAFRQGELDMTAGENSDLDLDFVAGTPVETVGT